MVSGQWSVVSCQLSVVSGQSSVISGWWCRCGAFGLLASVDNGWSVGDGGSLCSSPTLRLCPALVGLMTVDTDL
jgi:hypothetical protein